MLFSHFKHLDQIDCGPTCLCMVVKHYGKIFTLQTLRAKAKFGKESFTFLDTAQADEDIGFKTLAVKVDFE